MKLRKLLSKGKEAAEFVKTKKLQYELDQEAKEQDWLKKKDQEIMKLEAQNERVKQKADKIKKIEKLKKDLNKNKSSLKPARPRSMFMQPAIKEGSLFGTRSEFEGIRKKKGKF